MNNRLLDLIKRGYKTEDVINLASYTDEEMKYACDTAFQCITRNCIPSNEKFAVYIGGQPGSGKTILSMELKNKIKNAVEIGIDNYRMYHPKYLEIEKFIKNHWKDRIETEYDTKGNDIADFTHYFAGEVTDKLIEMSSNKGYNLLLEWGMREPTGPLNSMKNLKNKGYDNTVLFVVTNKNISYDACKLRAKVMENYPHIIRKVNKKFHDLCIEQLPNSISKIYEEGYKNKVIDYMFLVNRDGNVLWDDKVNGDPGIIFNEYVNSEIYNMKNDPLKAYNTGENELNNLNNLNNSVIVNYDYINSSIKR